MIYLIYINENYVTGLFSIDDVIVYIIDNNLHIASEKEDLDENTVKLYCEVK